MENSKAQGDYEPRKFTDFELGWLAGVIDSEGNINYHKNNYRIQLYNTNRKFLERFVEIVDYRGRMYVAHTAKGKLGNKKVYSLCISNKLQTLNILEQIKNYLIINRIEAEKMIRYKMNTKTYNLKRLKGDRNVLQPFFYNGTS